MRKVLFFDFQYSGHHVEYVNHLLKELSPDVRHQVFFAISTEMLTRLTADQTGIQFVALPKFTASAGPVLFREQGEWLVNKAGELDCVDVFFLNLDPYQYVIGSSVFRRSGLRVSGILFSPPHRIEPEETDGLSVRLSHYIRRIRKRWQLRWMLRNPDFRTAFLLDDPDTAKVLGQKSADKFAFLPDPIAIDGVVPGNSELFRQKYNLQPVKKTLLSFGTIVPRKNLLTVIEALGEITETSIGLVILGKGSPEYVTRLQAAATALEQVSTHRIVIENKFITDEEMEFAFSSSDIVLAIYRSFFCSSGIIGHAAKHNKPLLATENGVIGRSVERYGLGVATGSSRSAVVLGIKELLMDGSVFPVNPKAFLEVKTVENFAAHIFADIGMIDHEVVHEKRS